MGGAMRVTEPAPEGSEWPPASRACPPFGKTAPSTFFSGHRVLQVIDYCAASAISEKSV